MASATEVTTPPASSLTTPECVGSQTVGPFYSIGLDYLVTETLAPPEAAGRHITIEGTLFDAEGVPVPDAILELWQASPEGKYLRQPIEAYEQDGRSHAPDSFCGFARLSTHAEGRFRVHTVEPGPVPFADGRVQAPHIVVIVFMRGLLRHLVTRIYLPDNALNAEDPVLQLVPANRRGTLIARPSGNDRNVLQWDIHLQGDNETVFFEC